MRECGLNVGRGLAVFFGLLCLVAAIAGLHRRDLGIWWVDLRFLPLAVRSGWMAGAAIALLAFGVGMGRRAAIVVAGGFALEAMRDVARFYVLAGKGAIVSEALVPVSVFVAAAMVWIVLAAWRPGGRASRKWMAITVIACLVGFPLLQMVLFGKTDYRRGADAAVVLGARVYADGRPSEALCDRIDTACGLYREGLVRQVILSGGPGEGRVHETEAMCKRAVWRGVRTEDILIDLDGVNTAATAWNVTRVARNEGDRRLLVVTHFYHEARTKMAFAREGMEVYTVPARSERTLMKLPVFMVREVAAFWVYYLGMGWS